MEAARLETAQLTFADLPELAEMVRTIDAGLDLPSGPVADAAAGTAVRVRLLVGGVKLDVNGRVATVRGERRILVADDDVALLRKMLGPREATVTFDAVSDDHPGSGSGPSAPSASLVGRTLGGKYLIEAQIGAGSMGAVYRGQQLPLGTAVAIKAVHPDLSATPAFSERFFREAKAASLLDMQGAVRIIDFGEEPDGLAYVVSEYVQGRSLAAVLAKEGPLQPARAVSILLQVLAVLGKAHEAGVVHRNVKPDNVMLVPAVTDDGEPGELVKLCDFGIAKLLETTSRSISASLTAQGHPLGTPEYMSPEQAQGEPIDGRSDLYSVGVMLFQMVTGKLPFEAESAVKLLIEHISREPPPPSRVRPDVDPRFDPICLKAMAKKPDDRYANARVMRRAVRIAFAPPETMLGASSYLELPPPSVGRARARPSAGAAAASRLRWLVAGALLLGVLTVAAWLLLERH